MKDSRLKMMDRHPLMKDSRLKVKDGRPKEMDELKFVLDDGLFEADC
jgi:hypothetical protein